MSADRYLVWFSAGAASAVAATHTAVIDHVAYRANILTQLDKDAA